MPKPLVAPKNIRATNKKCCGTCSYRKNDDDGEMYCEREPDFPPWTGVDAADGLDEAGIHYVVCNGWKA